jgi:hypothetical protein
VSFADFFARYVAGADPLPYEDLLRRAGLRIEMQGGSVSIGEDSAAGARQRRLRTGLLQGTTN